jgi:hypothetical protein
MDAAFICPQCGTSATGRRFCTTCGAPFVDVPASAAEPVVEDPAASEAHSHTLVLPEQAAEPGPSPVVPWLSEHPVAQPPRTRPNVIALAVVAALALSGWAIWRGVEKHTLSGTLLLVDSTYSNLDPGTRCTGEGGYDDLGGGAQVVLRDDKGATLSTGRLTAGEFDGLGCAFSFALENVTRVNFYSLTVASGSRGELQYSYKELTDSNWSLALFLGDQS